MPFVVWLAVYVTVLYGLGTLVRPWRERRWFKVLFLPGTLLSVGLQRLSARLCLTAPCEAAPLKDRRPALRVDTKSVPALAGALFVVVSHLLLYIVFLIAVAQLEAHGWIDAGAASLPTIEAYELLEGRFELDLRDYARGLAGLFSEGTERTLALAVIAWVLAGVFTTFTMSRRQFQWCIVALVILGVVTGIMDWFGAGFPVLSRGWWARWFYFPEWWAIFSFFVTQLLITFTFFGVLRGVPVAFRRARGEGEDDER